MSSQKQTRKNYFNDVDFHNSSKEVKKLASKVMTLFTIAILFIAIASLVIAYARSMIEDPSDILMIAVLALYVIGLVFLIILMPYNKQLKKLYKEYINQNKEL
ncbi:MAG: hypothetical protein FWD39_03815 [Clostridiales bacterium]|nr:hypothetical protein [Clostridiales bacterium]